MSTKATERATQGVLDAVKRVVEAGRQKHARAAAMQKAAQEARKGGPSGPGAIEAVERAHPVVIDIGDAWADLEKAYVKYERARILR